MTRSRFLAWVLLDEHDAVVILQRMCKAKAKREQVDEYPERLRQARRGWFIEQIRKWRKV